MSKSKAPPRKYHMDVSLAARFQRGMRRALKKQCYISLQYVCSLTPEAAKVLLEWDNGILDLDGLTELPGDVADVLGESPITLSFNGLTELSEEAAGGLSKHRGNLCLDGLTTISTKIVRLLTASTTVDDGHGKESGRGTLCLRGLESLSIATAKALRRYDGGLRFGRHIEFTPDLARVLAKHEHPLGVEVMPPLSIEMAEAFATHRDNLLLGVSTLSEDVARALAKHGGGLLQLPYLSAITDEAAAALARYPGVVTAGQLRANPHVEEVLWKYGRNS